MTHLALASLARQASRLVLSALIFCCAAPALAADVDGTKTGPLADWVTETHLGYAVNDTSTTGFKNVAGSLAFLDLVHPMGDGLEVGLRTIGQGGRLPDRQYYRLGAGPLFSWNANENWTLQGSLSTFQESGIGPQDSHLYTSHGMALLLGWERVWRLGSRADVAVGGFISRQQGSLEDTAGPGSATAAAMSVNAGFCHGAEAALRVRL